MIFLVVASIAVFAGCAPKKGIVESNSTDFSSRLPDAGSSTKAVVNCNRATGTFGTAEIRPYIDVYGKTLVDKARINIKPAANFASSDTSLVFYRWMASYPNTLFSDSAPLELWLERKSGGAPLTGMLTKINWDEIDSILSDQDIVLNTPEELFEGYSFVVNLKDPEAAYDALAIASYANGTLSEKTNVLIPSFYASPNEYSYDTRKSETRPTILQDLHPFKSYLNSGTKDEDYKGMASALCSIL